MSGHRPPIPAVYPFSDRALLVITIAVVAFGCWLRLGWPLEIEYKADEAFMFERSQRVGTTESWPALGMPSGAGSLRNPGLSVSIFAGLAKISGAATPVALARCVQGLNCVALVGLAWFALRFSGEERRIWLWAVTLAAASPTAILLQRKIWAQSVLPLLCVLMLVAWWRRRTFWGALLWAALALVSAQIHMTGFFFFAAITLWTLLFWRTSMNWAGWAIGALLGSISAWPWLSATLPNLLHSSEGGLRLLHVFGPQYWVLWFTEGFGLGLNHNLGGDLPALLRYPLVSHHSTWLVGLATVTLCGVLSFFLWQSAQAFLHEHRAGRERLTALVATRSEAAFLCAGLMLVYGVLLSLPDLTLQRHYLLIAFPLPYLWLASAVLSPSSRWQVINEKLLLTAVVLNLFICSQLFTFLRANGGALYGDFGMSWRAQAAGKTGP